MVDSASLLSYTVDTVVKQVDNDADEKPAKSEKRTVYVELADSLKTWIYNHY